MCALRWYLSFAPSLAIFNFLVTIFSRDIIGDCILILTMVPKYGSSLEKKSMVVEVDL